MVSPQNLAIGVAAVNMAAQDGERFTEGDLFRRVIGWSLGLLLLMAVIVMLQATDVLGWMVP
jgi:lactate permease